MSNFKSLKVYAIVSCLYTKQIFDMALEITFTLPYTNLKRRINRARTYTHSNEAMLCFSKIKNRRPANNMNCNELFYRELFLF